MAQNKNFCKNLSETDLFDMICYNLAQYSYIEKQYLPFQGITDYGKFFKIMTNCVHLTAQAYQKQILTLQNQKLKETDAKKREEIQNQINAIQNNVSYNIHQVATNYKMAMIVTKSLMFLGNFDIVLADQKKQARPIDSVGRTGLLGDDNAISDAYLTHYQEKHSVGPLITSTTMNLKANQERVEMLLSLAKPNIPVYHQIWLNDHLMLQANTLTDKSLAESMEDYNQKLGEVFQLITYAEEIEKKANGNLTQEFINNEIKQMRMNYVKREMEKSLEQHAILAIELLGSLIKKLKKKSPLAQNSSTYDKLNLINGIQRQFTPAEIQKMNDYLTIRNNLSHPVEYNLRPMGENKNQNHLVDFVSDITTYLANFMNIPVQDVQNKINSIPKEEAFDVRPLIALMDTRKALRELCLKNENLPESTANIFLSLGFITKDENDQLNDAIELRNTLCHGKNDFTIAQKAEEEAIKAWKTINKIATCVDKKYNVSLKNHYQQSTQKISRSLTDFQNEFPFMNTSFETDPDKKLFENAIKNQKETSEDKKELLLKLYSFAIVLHDYFLNSKHGRTLPYEEKELKPFTKEMDDFLNNRQPGTYPTIKQIVLHGVLKGFEKGNKIPTLKTERVNN